MCKENAGTLIDFILALTYKHFSPNSTAFKKKFIKSKEILETSKEFVMVNVLAVSSISSRTQNSSQFL